MIDGLYRAFTGDAHLLNDVVMPDWQDIPLALGEGPRPAGVKPMIATLRATVPDVAITVNDMLIDGDRIGVCAEMTGTCGLLPCSWARGQSASRLLQPTAVPTN